MLKAHSISLTLGGRRLLADASLSVQPGEMLCLLGPNGAGKSTLIKMMTGEIQPDEGLVTLNETMLAHYHPAELADRRGVLSQHTDLAFGFTAAEVVALGDRRGTCVPEMIFWALDQVGMVTKARQEYPTLSGGEQQRVHLARVLLQLRLGHEAGKDQYLILDEPTASLDLAYQQRVLELARSLARDGLGVLAVLHDINQAMRFADRIAILKDGTVQAEGAPKAVATADRLSAVYGVHVDLLEDPVTGLPYIIPREPVALTG
ncbi:heme ABC transporter ATP-binding protein [Aestuariispira insulae]|uniref:Iron complex transport system ATP-binding protein n=1 Tax=Aestuariispira insulae TaxID=1461337 RepID=A0A3D9H3V7_9PROT|nr:heme ABC transporter ATP-binding protein [Aestuariispira insulae]RED44177.1 iron complex transport system ATP-binding protein [Aestuariispira insulae]